MIRLADIVGASGLSGYAIVALVLFVFAFVLVLIPVLAPGKQGDYTAASRLPFEDSTPDARSAR